MNALLETLLATLLGVIVCQVVLWLVSLRLRDASIADPAWGAGFVLVAWGAFLLNDPTATRSLLLAILTTLWGMRLTLYLLARNAGHGEDRRYAAMRARHGPRFARVSLWTVFLLQAVLLWFVSWPIQAAAANASRTPLGWIDLTGTLLWLVGFGFEATADWQLARFKLRPEHAGRVFDGGLWRYTRHPNYFGDFCVWWGIYLVAAAAGAWWTIASPLLMSYLLLRVSGVALLEQTIAERRPDYIRYQQVTSTFFPWPPRRGVSRDDADHGRDLPSMH